MYDRCSLLNNTSLYLREKKNAIFSFSVCGGGEMVVQYNQIEKCCCCFSFKQKTVYLSFIRHWIKERNETKTIVVK